MSPYFQAGLAPTTQRTYKAAMHRFFKFCTTFNITSPFPLSEHFLCAYAAYLADQHLAPQSIKSYLSALRSWQISLGLPDSTDNSSLPMLKRVQAGISRMRSLRGTPTKVRLPITSHLLRRIKRALDASEDSAKHVVWAIASTAFFTEECCAGYLAARPTCCTFGPLKKA